MGDNPGFEDYENSAQNIHKSMWAAVYASGGVDSDNAALRTLMRTTQGASYATENQALILLTKALDVLPAGGDGIPDPVATGATAGTPGSFTPANSTPPANLAAMDGIVANPLTLWTVGQRVVLGDASVAHWDGTDWVAGNAPS